MIKTKIQTVYAHQFNKIKKFTDNIYIADYTKQTRNSAVKRSVEFFSPTPPDDINSFPILNPSKIDVDGIEFDNNSFVWQNGQAKTQCEAVCFPSKAKANSWILFCELKYSSSTFFNEINLRKAIKQLYKTRYYYYQNNIITYKNTSYLIASLPLQS